MTAAAWLADAAAVAAGGGWVLDEDVSLGRSDGESWPLDGAEVVAGSDAGADGGAEGETVLGVLLPLEGVTGGAVPVPSGMVRKPVSPGRPVPSGIVMIPLTLGRSVPPGLVVMSLAMGWPVPSGMVMMPLTLGGPVPSGMVMKPVSPGRPVPSGMVMTPVPSGMLMMLLRGLLRPVGV